MRVLALAIASLIWSTMPTLADWTERDRESCRATGIHRNTFYGFVVRIPAGLHGCPNSPIGMSDHGVLIPLTRQESERSVECYATYNALFHKTIDEAADFDIASVGERSALPGSVRILRRTSGKLGSLQAIRVVAGYKDKTTGVEMIRDNTVALRQVIKAYSAPSHEYEVSLTTPARYYARDRATLAKILTTWQVGLAEDEPQK